MSAKLLKKYAASHGGKLFAVANGKLLCQACGDSFLAVQKSQVDQHLNTAKHRRNFEKWNGSAQRVLSSASFKKVDSFKEDLCLALIAADIPFHKLDNPTFRNFLTDYTNYVIPDRKTLSNNYLRPLYDNVIARIREDLQDKRIWVSMDEATDSAGRFVVNVIVGELSPESPTNCSYLLTSTFVDNANHSTMSCAFNDAMGVLWPDGIKYSNVLLLVTDAAKYMVKTGNALKKSTYGKLVHLTCAAHGLHRVAESIRMNFKAVNKLIANGKKVFLKSPYRRQKFKEEMPDIPLPPEPNVTRWGKWIAAAVYYSEHIDSVKAVIDLFDPEDSKCIREAQTVLSKVQLKNDLAYIHANFGFIVEFIKKLETRNLALVSSLSIMEMAVQRLENSAGPAAEMALDKLKYVLSHNPGYETMKEIGKILSGECGINFRNYTPDELASFKYATFVSAECERSFSIRKSIFSDRRHSFDPKNLSMYVVINCNTNAMTGN